MKEYLLSGYNTQESVAVARPLSLTGVAEKVNDGVKWMSETIYKGIEIPKISVPPALSVQGWLYLNIDYSVAFAILPFDPTTLGVPVEFLKEHPEYKVEEAKVGTLKVFKILWQFRGVYRQVKRFYEETLPGLDAKFRDLHYKLHTQTHVDFAEVWPYFDEEHHELMNEAANAHNLINVVLVSLDSVLQQQVPELRGLLTGQETTTSLMGQHVWELRNLALACGSEVTGLLKEGVTDLARYDARPEAAPFVEALHAFLKNYGHRGLRYELDAASPRLLDHPEQVLLAVATQLDQETPPAHRAEEARASAEAKLHAMPPVKRAIWTRLLNWAQRLIGWREASKSYLSLGQSTLGALTRHIHRQFYPDAPDDIILYYTFSEFNEFLLSQATEKVPEDVLERRRAEFELHFSQTPPPELIWYDPETGHWRPAIESQEQPMNEDPKHFEGIGASSGSGPVEGLALVTNDPVEAGRRLLEMKGDVILVTRLTDPAWSSLFARLSGVVTELGGVISHAAIVARENGLPAIVGIPDVTRHIHDGQPLRIDGATGVVEVLE